jgi:hypothetical protein
MLSSNLQPEPKRRNFVLLNNIIYNIYINFKPSIVEDILDVVQYFQSFQLWKTIEDLKPSIRPCLNKKLVQSKPSTIKLRKLIIR